MPTHMVRTLREHARKRRLQASLAETDAIRIKLLASAAQFEQRADEMMREYLGAPAPTSPKPSADSKPDPLD